MAIYRKGKDDAKLRKAASEQATVEKNTPRQFQDHVRNDSYNIGLTGTPVSVLNMRHKMLGQERPISGAGLAEGSADAKKSSKPSKKYTI